VQEVSLSLPRSSSRWTSIKGFDVFEEVTSVDNLGRNRRIDIVAFHPRSNDAYLIDPTVRYQSNWNMETEVEKDKTSIYNQCIEHYKQRYRHKGEREFEIIPLWFGARGSVSNQVLEFFDRFQLDKNAMLDIAQGVLVDTLKMLHYHQYGCL